MQLPILINHDPRRPIGSVALVGSSLRVSFSDEARITKEMLFEAFGNLGFRVHRSESGPDGKDYIREAEILEWSVGEPTQ